jgi:hypothetical protein
MCSHPTAHPAYNCVPEAMNPDGRPGLMDGRSESMAPGGKPEDDRTAPDGRPAGDKREPGDRPEPGGKPEPTGDMPERDVRAPERDGYC